MISCYYKDIADVECQWQGVDEDFSSHLTSFHEVLSYSSCKHNKIVLELILDLDSSGYRFVIITFMIENLEYTCYFEEYFDETENIFKVLLRSHKAAGKMYNIVIQGKFAMMEFCGCIQGFEENSIENSSQCLQMFGPQLKRFAFIEGDELRYKVVISII